MLYPIELLGHADQNGRAESYRANHCLSCRAIGLAENVTTNRELFSLRVAMSGILRRSSAIVQLVLKLFGPLSLSAPESVIARCSC